MKEIIALNAGLIITGTGRSGTTLMWQLLNAHSQLRLCYEPFNFGLDIKDFHLYTGIKQPTWYWNFENHTADKYIFLKRDILDTLYSLIVRNNSNYNLIKEYYEKIIAINEQIDNFVNNNPKKSLIVNYQRLCIKTQLQMREVCTFLEIPFELKIMSTWGAKKPPKEAKSAQYNLSYIRYQTKKYINDKKFMEAIKNLGVK